MAATASIHLMPAHGGVSLKVTEDQRTGISYLTIEDDRAHVIVTISDRPDELVELLHRASRAVVLRHSEWIALSPEDAQDAPAGPDGLPDVPVAQR